MAIPNHAPVCPRAPRRCLLALGSLLLGAAGALAVVGAPAPASAGELTNVSDPSGDLVPQPAFSTECTMNSLDSSTPCQAVVLRAIDEARRAEGLAPLNLPPDYDQLDPGQQLFVLANLERVARGLPALSGMTADLDAAAQAGAAGGYDPVPPSYYEANGGFVSNWGAGIPNALAADFYWMYDDGWNGVGQTFNAACTSPESSGCWGHRDDILVDPAAFGCSTGCSLLAGAAESPASSGWPTSFAEVIVMTHASTPPDVFGWSQVAATMRSIVVNCAAPSSPSGYRMFGSDGSAYDFGNLPYCGGMNEALLDRAVVGGTSTPNGGGYWLVASDGGIFTFGNAHYYGSEGGKPLNAPIVGMASVPGGGGYWLVAADGGVFSFGSARYHGSEGGKPLNAPIVGMAATPDGGGYWLVASDGGIFTFGDARYYGSEGGVRLNAPIVGMAPTSNGKGYWLAAADGGIFTFGDARYDGSLGSAAPPAGVVAVSGP